VFDIKLDTNKLQCTLTESVSCYVLIVCCSSLAGGYELVAREESYTKYTNIWLSCYRMSQKTRCCPALSRYWGFV